MSFTKLPVELQALILSNLDSSDLQKTAQVSKITRHQSKELLSTLHAGHQEVKTLPDTSHYYAVGGKVLVSQPTNIWDKGFPYQKERKSIPENEIKNAIPKQGTMKLFRTQKEAQEYARCTSEQSHATIDRMAAVFQVQLKETTVSPIVKEEITPALHRIYRMGPSKKPIEYVQADVKNLEFVSGQVSDYPAISLQNKNEACYLM
ncbi:F-box protein [Fluoribacter dumoffii]|uniref:F-box protein n=1 Tax=Fluoribacter dumoffii TaxID=463 RepID=UPI002243409A|nr:F-box protein [Fluoribacter dumoffii]MCW8386934.1 F-box protein [Fluoribacter dumoffii]